MRSFIMIFLLFPLSLAAQQSGQVIKGTIIDKDTRQPLEGATVTVFESSPILGVFTDFEGNFRLENVPLGRQQINVSYVGYGSYLSEPLVLNSAKEATLNIELVESGIMGEEVIVSSFQNSNEPLNELAIVSTRSFSVEETQRYAASANDPGRMSMGFPGVQPTRDSRSDIVVRGNSGIGLLWRLEGIDIPNPNHFARRGSSGGGITVFSVSMLGNSDFSTGAFPAEYGNAFSGVFDIRLRNGNKEKKEYSFRAGMLGLDLSTEGPIKKGKSSYLINYRYSTLGLLNQLGIYLVNPRADNVFQDLSFKLNFNGNPKSSLSIWGIGGLSDEFERAIDELTAESSYAEKLTRDFQTDMGAVGITHTYLLNDKSYLKSALAISGQNIIFNNDILNVDRVPTMINRELYKTNRSTFSSIYHNKINKKLNFKGGLYLHGINYNLNWQNVIDGQENNWANSSGFSTLYQPFVQFRYNPTDKLNVNVGAHAMYLYFNSSFAVNPRLGIRYTLNEGTQLSFAYGLHSRMLPIGNYFINLPGGASNVNLDFIRAHHLVLAADHFFTKQWKMHAEIYYQHLFNVPVENDINSTYSLLNIIDGFANVPLVNEGTGTNIGLDLSVEKVFSGGSFAIISASIFDSKYTDLAKRSHNGRYNSNFSATLMSGKEWNFQKDNSLTASLKILYNQGARITPLLGNISGDGANPPFDESRPFEDRVSPYFRPDIRLAYRKSRPKIAWTLSLDVQNVISRRNEDALDRIYSPETGQWTDRVQSGLTPLLSYQLDF